MDSGEWKEWRAVQPRPFRACHPCAAGPAAVLVRGLAVRDPVRLRRAGRHRVLSLVLLRPSRQTAWESVYFLQSQVAGGWLLRAIHHYTAHVLLALLIIYLVQSILTRACRAPRELVFWATVAMALFALAAFLTGDLLPWDQQGYYATKTRTGFLTLLPWVGRGLLKLAIGGPGPGFGHAHRNPLLRPARRAVLRRIPAVARRPQRACPPGARGAGWRSARWAWPAALACLAIMAVVLWLALRHDGARAALAGRSDRNPRRPARVVPPGRL